MIYKQNTFVEAMIAARHKEKLTQEKAAELLGVSVDSLANYELGRSRTPADVAYNMSFTYRAPELRNTYCATMCDLGCKTAQLLERKEGFELAVQYSNKAKQIDNAKEMFMRVMDDGIIEDEEVEEVLEILKATDEFVKVGKELRLMCEKQGITNSRPLDTDGAA